MPRNNLPKQFCERCFEQGDQKWQQDELELVLELDIRVCGRKKKCVGAGISGGGPPWAHEAGGAPRGVGRTLHPRGCLVSFPDCFLFFYFSKYSKTEIYCLKDCLGVGLLTVPHTYSFSESETFRKVSFMYSSGVMVSITLVSTFIGLPEI